MSKLSETLVITVKLGISHQRAIQFMGEILAPLWQIYHHRIYLRALDLRNDTTSASTTP